MHVAADDHRKRKRIRKRKRKRKRPIDIDPPPRSTKPAGRGVSRERDVPKHTVRKQRAEWSGAEWSEAERSAPFPTAFALTASFSFIPLIRTPARGKKAAPARGKKAATQSATQVEER